MASLKGIKKAKKKEKPKTFWQKLFSFDGLKVWYADKGVWFKKTIRW